MGRIFSKGHKKALNIKTDKLYCFNNLFSKDIIELKGKGQLEKTLATHTKVSSRIVRSMQGKKKHNLKKHKRDSNFLSDV